MTGNPKEISAAGENEFETLNTGWAEPQGTNVSTVQVSENQEVEDFDFASALRNVSCQARSALLRMLFDENNFRSKKLQQFIERNAKRNRDGVFDFSKTINRIASQDGLNLFFSSRSPADFLVAVSLFPNAFDFLVDKEYLEYLDDNNPLKLLRAVENARDEIAYSMLKDEKDFDKNWISPRAIDHLMIEKKGMKPSAIHTQINDKLKEYLDARMHNIHPRVKEAAILLGFIKLKDYTSTEYHFVGYPS